MCWRVGTGGRGALRFYLLSEEAEWIIFENTSPIASGDGSHGVLLSPSPLTPLISRGRAAMHHTVEFVYPACLLTKTDLIALCISGQGWMCIYVCV